MSQKKRQRIVSSGLTLIVLLSAVGYLFGGNEALLGSFLGCLASVVSIGSVSMVVALLASRLPKPKTGAVFTVVMLILKLPLLVLCLYFGTRLLGWGMGCFLGTIGLVYSHVIAYLAYSA